MSNETVPPSSGIWRWTNPHKQRFYRVDLFRDLLGDWILAQSWGSTHSRLGGQRMMRVPSFEGGLDRLQLIDRRRLQRGYARDRTSDALPAWNDRRLKRPAPAVPR